MLKEVFYFPQHNERSGCCYLCRVTPDHIRDTGVSAEWRTQRLDLWSVIEKQRTEGKPLSPLFWAPGIALSTFKLDWLHIADLGVGADWLGQLLTVLMSKMPGNNKGERLAALWRRIRELYATPEFGTDSKLDDLYPTMLKATKDQAPKLKCNAAECRGFMPIAHRMAQDLLSRDDPFELTVLTATEHLLGCYQCLSRTQDEATLARHSRRFCTLWVSLEEVHGGFRIKPKMHLFQELCEMAGPTQPAAHWAYRDEDVWGSMLTLATRRGGRQAPGSTSQRAIRRFTARYSLPQIGR